MLSSSILSSHSQDAIGCLASMTDSSITKKVLLSLFERSEFADGDGEFGKLMSHKPALIDKEQGNLCNRDVQR